MISQAKRILYSYLSIAMVGLYVTCLDTFASGQIDQKGRYSFRSAQVVANLPEG